MAGLHRQSKVGLCFALLCLASCTRAVEVSQHYAMPEEAHQEMPHEAVDLNTVATKVTGDESGNMESLLHWAISNSNPELLKQQADDVRKHEAITNLMEKRGRVKELLDIMNQQPTETDLTKEALNILNHADVNDDQRLSALMALQILVEPIDNANDLATLHGLDPVTNLLSSGNHAVQAAAAHVVGTAAANNPKFQDQLLTAKPDIFTQLIKLVSHEHQDVVVKGLYAAAAMVRNQDTMRDAFFAAGGIEAVQQVLTMSSGKAGKGGSPMLRAQRKALSLLVDLVHLDGHMTKHCLQKGIPSTITELLRQADHDLQEKAVDALLTLLRTQHGSAAKTAFHTAGAVEELGRLHASLMEQVQEPAAAGDLDDHYFKYLLGLVVEAQRELRHTAAAPKVEL